MTVPTVIAGQVKPTRTTVEQPRILVPCRLHCCPPVSITAGPHHAACPRHRTVLLGRRAGHRRPSHRCTRNLIINSTEGESPLLRRAPRQRDPLVTLAGSASKISPGASVVTPRSHCVFIFFHHHSVSNGCGNFDAAVAQELRAVSYLMGSKDGAYVVCSVWGTLDPLGASGDFRLDTTNSCIAFP